MDRVQSSALYISNDIIYNRSLLSRTKLKKRERFNAKVIRNTSTVSLFITFC